MTQPAEGTEEPADAQAEVYGTRWRAMVAALLASMLVVVGIGTAVGTGALAVSFVAENGNLALATNGLTGKDLEIVAVQVPVKNPDGTQKLVWQARIAVGAAQANSLCVAQQVSILGAPFSLLISAGDTDPSTYEIPADGLILDVTSAVGVISTTGELLLNKNGADVGGATLGATSDSFGLQADGADLRGLTARVRDVTVPNVLSLPGFSAKVEPGVHTCPAPTG